MERVSISMEVLRDIIRGLNESQALRDIFGDPVSKGLVLYTEDLDLRIACSINYHTTEEEERTFDAEMARILGGSSD